MQRTTSFGLSVVPGEAEGEEESHIFLISLIFLMIPYMW